MGLDLVPLWFLDVSQELSRIFFLRLIPPLKQSLDTSLVAINQVCGCAEASKSVGGNKMCNTSVVSYLHPPLDLLSHSQHVLLLLIFFVSHEVRVYIFVHFSLRYGLHAFSLHPSLHVQCRYARPGNCNMQKYKSLKKDWWIEPMLLAEGDVCGPKCPPKGCH